MLKLFAIFAIACIFALGSTLGLLARVSGDETEFTAEPRQHQASSVAVPTPEDPLEIRIGRLGVEADIESVTTDSEGRMDVPKKDENVAWWSLGVRPGQVGNAVFAGHFDDPNGDPAVFYDLGELTAGDIVEVVDESKNIWKFKVINIGVYKDANFPIETVFGSSRVPKLNLITCEGVYNSEAQNYDERLVVYTELVS